MGASSSSSATRASSFTTSCYPFRLYRPSWRAAYRPTKLEDDDSDGSGDQIEVTSLPRNPTALLSCITIDDGVAVSSVELPAGLQICPLADAIASTVTKTRSQIDALSTDPTRMPNYRLLGHDQYGVSPFPHSCTPSAWVVGHFIELRRTVRAGDAITLDFTFFETESSLYHGRPCMCGCGAPALAFDKWRDVGLMKIARRHVGRLIAAKFKENGWHDPRIEVRHSRASGMLGLHCRGTTISAGELIAVFAGKTIHRKYMFKPGAVSSRDYEMSLQIQDELWQIPNEDGPETTDYINHSCAPSAGMKDSVSLVAIRDIVPGEEVTIDYGMVNNGLLQNASDNFVCRCRATNCRGRITTNDWQHPNVRRLQQYCSPFVQEKMSATTSIC